MVEPLSYIHPFYFGEVLLFAVAFQDGKRWRLEIRSSGDDILCQWTPDPGLYAEASHRVADTLSLMADMVVGGILPLPGFPRPN